MKTTTTLTRILSFIIIAACFSFQAKAQWVQQVSGTNSDLSGVFGVDDDSVYVTSVAGMTLKTINGGANWGPIDAGNLRDHRDVFFTSAGTGVVVGRDHAGACFSNFNRAMVRKTFDYGQTWDCDTLELFDAGWLRAVHFSSANVGYTASDGGFIHKTIDGGATWDTVGPPVGAINDIFFINDNTGWMVGISGFITKTTDGGNNWTLQNSGTTNDLQGIFFTDPNNGTLVGDGGILKRTTNGGATWGSILTLIMDYKDVFFVNASTGYVCGSNGNIRKTIDGGNTWLNMVTPVNDVLYAIHFPSVNTGYCVGANGAIIKYGVSCSGFSASSNVTSNYSGEDVTCQGACDGSAAANPSGGCTPYTYLWSTGGTGATVSGLCATVYTVTVTDCNSCTSVSSVTLTEPSALVLNGTQVNVGCFGDSTGSASAPASGGISPYSYSWSTGATGTNISNLPTGTYTVTVFDGNGCTKELTFNISEPALLTGAGTSVDASCGNNDGSATANPSGGTSPYNYQWDANAGNQTTQTATNLSAGNYDVTVTDDNGCTTVITVMVGNINGPAVTLSSSTNPLCNGDCNGDATVNVTGGASPYAYLWSSGGTTGTETGLCDGTYTVTVTDNNNCIDILIVTITEPALLTATSSTTDDSGNCDGTAIANPSGGTSPYTYQWDANTGNQTDQTATALCAGAYCVTITDINGCTTALCDTVDLSTGSKTIPDFISHCVIYPNPNSGVFVVEIELASSSDVEITLVNTIGQAIYFERIGRRNGKFQQQIELKSTAKGIYILKVQTDDRTLFRNVVVW